MKTLLSLFLLFGICHSWLIDVNFTTPFNTTVNRGTEIANDGYTPWIYFVEQAGTIKAVQSRNATTAPIYFLNITDRVYQGADTGLFGLAFHPNYNTNGYFFVSYSIAANVLAISRFRADSNNLTSPFRIANASTELVLMRIPLNGINTGGKLAFFNGYFYISVGVDGDNVTTLGLRNDNFNGKVLRINVDGLNSTGNYSIPLDNPFYNNSNYLPEIWASGFRHLWKFSFDCATGWMYGADEGISSQEEIDFIRAGLNYGYPIFEGILCINSSYCNSTGLTFPILTYNHTGQSRAIIGGYVYRGTALPQLIGYYIFADFTTGNLWALDVDSGADYSYYLLGRRLFPSISTFGQDIYGNIYFTQYATGTIWLIGNSSNSTLLCQTRNGTSLNSTASATATASATSTASGTSPASATSTDSLTSVGSSSATGSSSTASSGNNGAISSPASGIDSSNAGLSTVRLSQNTNAASSRFTFTFEESSANKINSAFVFGLLALFFFLY